MRGPLPVQTPARERQRIIPAYAGTTKTRRLKEPPSKDHPRLCGDHASMSAIQKDILGSSPPMRGPLVNKEVPVEF